VQENNDLTVSVETLKDNNIKFYMFNVEGRLIKELNIQESKKISITQLEKGIYIYDFFSKDKRIKNGQIALR
jgi:nitrous oxidase accessory protein NosD